jgi:small subunit ribosomal protein S8
VEIKKETQMDPIGNMLCCIRNGQHAKKTYVCVPYSRVVWAVLKVCFAHGYIRGMGRARTQIVIVLKQTKSGFPVLQQTLRVSSAKRRVYINTKNMQAKHAGLSMRILSTSKGIMAEGEARQAGLGGEVLCELF